MQHNQHLNLRTSTVLRYEGFSSRNGIAREAMPERVQYIYIVRNADVFCGKARATRCERRNMASPGWPQAWAAGSGSDKVALCNADIGEGDHCGLEGHQCEGCR